MAGTPSDYTVGFVGVGYMGVGMVENLVRAGIRVRMYNRTKAKAQTLADSLRAELGISKVRTGCQHGGGMPCHAMLTRLHPHSGASGCTGQRRRDADKL